MVSDYTSRFWQRCGDLQFAEGCAVLFIAIVVPTLWEQTRNYKFSLNPEVSSTRRQLVRQLVIEQIQWRFNPLSAPYFGGIWEAAVKLLKHHLRWVVGDSKLIFEEMNTLLAQVEACLNSRSLQTLSDDPENLAALTPGHFLAGSALTAISEPSLLNQSNKPADALATSPKDAKSLLGPLVLRVFTFSRSSPEMVDQGVGIQCWTIVSHP